MSFGSLLQLAALPQLQRLKIITADPHQLELQDLEAPNLRSFVLHGLRFAYSYDTPSALSQALASIRWPKLEEFEARLAETWTCNVPRERGAYVKFYSVDGHSGGDRGENEGTAWNDELTGVLENLKQTPLKRLVLTSFASAGQLLEALMTHGLPATLEELDLSESDLSASNVKALLNIEAFRGLKRLVLNDTRLNAKSVERLQGADLGPEIVCSGKGGARYRYLVGME